MIEYTSNACRTTSVRCIIPNFKKKFYAQFGDTLRAFRFISTEMIWGSAEVSQSFVLDVAGLGLRKIGYHYISQYLRMPCIDVLTPTNRVECSLAWKGMYASVADFRKDIVASDAFTMGRINELYDSVNLIPLRPVDDYYTFRGYKWSGCQAVEWYFNVPNLTITKEGIEFNITDFWEHNEGLYFSKQECEDDNNINVVDFDDEDDDNDLDNAINVLGKEYFVKTNVAIIKQCANILEGLLTQ